jgi:hypothetical protein
MTEQPKWKTFLENNKWTTYLAYELNQDSTNPVNTLLKYEKLLTQCSYLSRMAYCPADIFCRMTQHLDVTPNAFNNYIRAIEKIYDKLFNYKCSYDSSYIQKHSKFSNNFNSISGVPSAPNNEPIGFFVQNKERMNVYLYVHGNTEKTLFIAFKGSSSINDFIHDLKSATKEDLFLSELKQGLENNRSKVEMYGGLKQYNYQSLNEGINLQVSTESNSKSNSKSNQVDPQIKQGKAGYGFIHVLKPSIQEICKRIEELKSHQFTRVIITGHSLGGALASLFGYYLKKYNPNLVNVPIHVVTFGACCVFDAPGRNEFNSFLNISDPVFTLDRVTANFDPVIVLPVDLDHPGYTLLRTELRAFTKTGRTNEIGEIRKMLGLERGYDGNDLLLSEKFVDLFTNSQDFKGTGKFNTDLYREKFRIKFGTNAKEQQLILEKAMPDAKPAEIRGLFKTIESDAGNKRYDDSEQAGGLHNPFSKEKREPQKLATEEYKKETEQKMPNQIQYSCYKTMTMGVCHASYMGVSYMMVIRLPNIKEGKLRKEPTKDYTLYQKDGRIFSLSSVNYSNNSDCTKVETNVKANNNSRKNNQPSNYIKNQNSKKNKNKKTDSFMNRFTGFFKPKKNNKKNNSVGNIELQPMNPNNSNSKVKKEENQAVFSKCSIL